jgi:hypothetical protein
MSLRLEAGHVIYQDEQMDAAISFQLNTIATYLFHVESVAAGILAPGNFQPPQELVILGNQVENAQMINPALLDTSEREAVQAIRNAVTVVQEAFQKKIA